MLLLLIYVGDGCRCLILSFLPFQRQVLQKHPVYWWNKMIETIPSKTIYYDLRTLLEFGISFLEQLHHIVSRDRSLVLSQPNSKLFVAWDNVDMREMPGSLPRASTICLHSTYQELSALYFEPRLNSVLCDCFGEDNHGASMHVGN